jgi:hypothetical protein
MNRKPYCIWEFFIQEVSPGTTALNDRMAQLAAPLFQVGLRPFWVQDGLIFNEEPFDPIEQELGFWSWSVRGPHFIGQCFAKFAIPAN